jgi:hypothetical protein
LKVYRVQICNVAADDDLSLYYSFPPTRNHILRSLEKQPFTDMIGRCVLAVDEFGDEIQFVSAQFPHCLHGRSDSYIEISVIDLETNEPNIERTRRVLAMCKRQQSLITEARRLFDEARHIGDQMREERDSDKLARLHRVPPETMILTIESQCKSEVM